MPDYPATVYSVAADAIERHVMSGKDYDNPMDSVSDLARAALDAVAEQLGEHCASKLRAHADDHGRHVGPAWRRYFGIAARVASRAFLTEADLKRLAVEALARGDYAVCQVTEDGDDAR